MAEVSEREAIVAWLRSRIDNLDGCGELSEYAGGREAACHDFGELIDAIERGDHLNPENIND